MSCADNCRREGRFACGQFSRVAVLQPAVSGALRCCCLPDTRLAKCFCSTFFTTLTREDARMSQLAAGLAVGTANHAAATAAGPVLGAVRWGLGRAEGPSACVCVCVYVCV